MTENTKSNSPNAENLVNLANSIRVYRHASGRTQKDLARKLDMDPTALSRFESGQRRISYQDLISLIRIYVAERVINSLEEANNLLHLAGYASLSESEISSINKNWHQKAESPYATDIKSQKEIQIYLGNLLRMTKSEIDKNFSPGYAQENPELLIAALNIAHARFLLSTQDIKAIDFQDSI